MLAPIGPLTNIALLLRLHPELAPRIAHVCLMGGSIGDGNTTVSAEFNIYADPEAAAIVFESGLPITMMGLDVTHQAVLYPPASERLRGLGTRSGASPRSSPTTRSQREGQWYGTPRMSVHDAVAVAHLAIPDLVDGRGVRRPGRHRQRAGARPDGVRRPARADRAEGPHARKPRSASGSTATASRTCWSMPTRACPRRGERRRGRGRALVLALAGPRPRRLAPAVRWPRA